MQVPDQIRQAIVAHAHWAFPEEACGLLAADDTGRLTMAYCLTNAERSTHRFTVDPVEQYHAIRHAERSGWHIAGSFHSHPRSAAVPSRADLSGALDPTWVHLIAGPVDGAIEVRAYRLHEGTLMQVESTAGVTG